MKKLLFIMLGLLLINIYAIDPRIKKLQNTVKVLKAKNAELLIAVQTKEELVANIVAFCNKRIDSLKTIELNRNAQITQLNTDKTSLQGQVSQLTTDKTNLQTQVTKLTTDKATLQTQVNTLTTQLANIDAVNNQKVLVMLQYIQDAVYPLIHK